MSSHVLLRLGHVKVMASAVNAFESDAIHKHKGLSLSAFSIRPCQAKKYFAFPRFEIKTHALFSICNIDTRDRFLMVAIRATGRTNNGMTASSTYDASSTGTDLSHGEASGCRGSLAGKWND